MAKTSIEWTHRPGSVGATWNPTVGCTEISPGCKHCYARTMHARLTGMGAARLSRVYADPKKRTAAERSASKYRDQFHVVKEWPDALDMPLRARKPTTYFVNSMSDLFHKDISNEYIAAVFGVMAACPQHTFQILTKRAERLQEWFAWAGGSNRCLRSAQQAGARFGAWENPPWPLPNVWLGVSVESQKYADERVPHLLSVPAAVRFVSYEPALGPVSFFAFLSTPLRNECLAALQSLSMPGLDWIIVGGESGPGARPFNLAWARSVVAEGKAAGVSVFVKQLGACAQDAPNGIAGASLFVPDVATDLVSVRLRARKGGDPTQWPADLRVREHARAHPRSTSV